MTEEVKCLYCGGGYMKLHIFHDTTAWSYTQTHTHTRHTTHGETALITGEIQLNFMVHINVNFRLLTLYHSYANQHLNDLLTP